MFNFLKPKYEYRIGEKAAAKLFKKSSDNIFHMNNYGRKIMVDFFLIPTGIECYSVDYKSDLDGLFNEIINNTPPRTDRENVLIIKFNSEEDLNLFKLMVI